MLQSVLIFAESQHQRVVCRVRVPELYIFQRNSPSRYRNRQDAREALDIAARGKVKCHYTVKGLSDLKECLPTHTLMGEHRLISFHCSVYEGMENGSVAGRVVLDMTK